MLIDTHAHIHIEEFATDLDGIFENCKKAQVLSIITVGTSGEDSRNALEFCMDNSNQGINIYATAGIHPHEAGSSQLSIIQDLIVSGGYGNKLVAIGECGLDYYKNYATKADQLKCLELQIELAISHRLPLVFHVRDAWEDFFVVLKNYNKLSGVIHSFTGTTKEVDKANEYNLYFGLNGIMTFTKDHLQLDAFKAIPASRLILETDCPYLSPAPLRGNRNEPANIKYIAEKISELRGEPLDMIATTTTTNTKTLFGVE